MFLCRYRKSKVKEKRGAHILRSTHAQTDCVAPSKPFNAARFPA